MQIKEWKLRVYGYLVMAGIFYFFFMLEMFFSWRDEHLWIKTVSVTAIYTALIWEPVRYFILRQRRRHAGLKNLRKRIFLTLLIVVPYAALVGVGRVFSEDILNLWGVPVATITYYSSTVGISLLFVLLQIAVYESLYFFDEWNISRTETEELKKMNFQIQFDTLKSQIQPHFLFNTLNTLIGLMKFDIPRAIEFTEEMAHVYRYLLEANERELISLEEEMKFTKAYFFLLKTRYSEGLYWEDNQTELMAGFQLPPLSLQILVENAVKHNIITRDRPLKIKIDFQPAASQLQVTNNIQLRPRNYNTGLGLSNLVKKFDLLRLNGLRILEDSQIFCVTIPLIKTSFYESGDN